MDSWPSVVREEFDPRRRQIHVDDEAGSSG
jgi:hypothetical protein